VGKAVLFGSPSETRTFRLLRLLRRNTLLAYAISVASVVLAVLVRFAIGEGTVPGVPFITFYPAIIFTTLLGGLGPGLLAVLLSSAAAWYFFLPPAYSWVLGQQEALALIALQTRRDNLPLFVFYHLDQLVLAPWAFKSAPVVVWCVIGLNSNEPHLRVANLATRTTHYPRMRDDLRSSHDAPHDYRSGSAVVRQQPSSRTADKKIICRQNS
jgi:hypothetical protein